MSGGIVMAAVAAAMILAASAGIMLGIWWTHKK